MAEEIEPQFAQDEDLERAKAFWKENGRSIIAGIVLGVSAIAGYNGWQYWQKTQGENASMLYENMRDSDISFEAATSLAKDLVSDYASTPYAASGSLLLAKKAVEQGALEQAASSLKWVLSNSKDTGLQHVARIRLAMVLLAQNDADGALDLVKGYGVESVNTEFVARYFEISGDAYALKGNIELARESYGKAQQLQPEGAANGSLLKLKLDNLGNF